MEEEPEVNPWGLFEMMRAIRRPRLVLVEVPPRHPVGRHRGQGWSGNKLALSRAPLGGAGAG